MELIIFIHVVPTQATRSAFCFLHLARRLHFFLDMCSVICLTVEGKPRKNLNQEIDPTGDRTRARCVKSSDVTPRPQRRPVLELQDILKR